MKIFVLLGQSNMAGPHISQANEEDDRRLEGVMLLNASDEFEPASNPLNKYSTIKWQPLPGLNPGVTFAENNVTIMSALNVESTAQIEALADELAGK